MYCILAQLYSNSIVCTRILPFKKLQFTVQLSNYYYTKMCFIKRNNNARLQITLPFVARAIKGGCIFLALANLALGLPKISEIFPEVTIVHKNALKLPIFFKSTMHHCWQAYRPKCCGLASLSASQANNTKYLNIIKEWPLR